MSEVQKAIYEAEQVVRDLKNLKDDVKKAEEAVPTTIGDLKSLEDKINETIWKKAREASDDLWDLKKTLLIGFFAISLYRAYSRN